VVVSIASLGLIHQASRRPRLTSTLAMVLLATDLAVANSWLVWTVPQSVFEGEPRVASLIEAAERSEPGGGPFRIVRIGQWYPDSYLDRRSLRRLDELTAWERDTLRMIHPAPFGLSTSLTEASLELEAHALYFQGRSLPASAASAPGLGIVAGQPVFYYPRASFDLWNTRYFLLPVRNSGWATRERGFASLTIDVETVFPKFDLAQGEGRRDLDRWSYQEDWQLVRNRTAFPRAWIVHYAHVMKPARSDLERADLMKRLLYRNDPIWSEPGRSAYNLRAMAFIEEEEGDALRDYNVQAPVAPGESVTITRYDPLRVELDAVLSEPGFVILADAYYPGWRLTIDGRPATIHRANLLMRGAAVERGAHHLVYEYDPMIWRVGLALSGFGLMAMVASLVGLAGFSAPEPSQAPGPGFLRDSGGFP
jgi:hypothetical protein